MVRKHFAMSVEPLLSGISADLSCNVGFFFAVFFKTQSK